MTALSIQPPYPTFTDTDGQPLENGYIWIGTANLNPITNPITAYWDAALTVTAAQPIRTLNGYPERWNACAAVCQFGLQHPGAEQERQRGVFGAGGYGAAEC
jgi:hypothetical protein